MKFSCFHLRLLSLTLIVQYCSFGESRLQTCRLVLAAVHPTDTPASPCGGESHCEMTKDMRSSRVDPVNFAIPGGKWGEDGMGNKLATDDPIEGFLVRQLRLLMESASGRHVEGSYFSYPQCKKPFLSGGVAHAPSLSLLDCLPRDPFVRI